ncbi:hypothetical protein [Psychroserpens sp.]
MNYSKYLKIAVVLLCTCIVLLAFSCKSISVQSKQYLQTSQNITLGSIGIDENFILERTYSNVGIPKYFKPVKVNIIPNSFNNSAYTAFNKAKSFQNKTIKISFHDSLKVKPNFISIDISDRITLINLLNHKENLEVKNFLLNDNDAHIVAGISIVFDKTNQLALINAEEIYIEQSGVENVALKLYNESRLDKTINFNEGVVFSYRAASVCWKENSKYQLEIVDLVEGDNGCPSQTYKSSKRAKKDINYYKF